MPGLKRPRREVDNELDGALDDEDAGSETDNSKRPRTSSPEESDESEDEEDLRGTDVEDYETTQAERRQQGNEAAENGIIEEVTMINFMCHTHLSIKFGPLINFVIGHNGSGKSAALTALTIGLGGKAIATNRGSSLKNFIQNGKDQATLIVKLKNKGDTGFRTEDFGDSIIIERTFNRAGSSGFKIKNTAGRIISTKKADVDDITDYYGLQIDNPLTVLTQDKARQFLSNSSPAEKYTFFTQAVQLAQLEQDYQLIDDHVKILSSTSEDRETDLQDLRAKYEGARANYLATSRIQDLRDKLEVSRMKCVWIQVAVQERKLRDLNQELEKQTAQIEQAVQEAAEGEAKLDAATGDVEIAGDAVTRAKAEQEPIVKENESAQLHREQIKRESGEIQAQHRQAKDEIKKYRDRVAKKKSDIEDEERRLEQQNGSTWTRRNQELEEKKTAAKEAKTTYEQHLNGLAAHKEAITRSEEAQSKHKSGRPALEQSIQDTEQELRNLHAGDSTEKAYPRDMFKLIQAIQRDPGFRSRPIGPLGTHIHLKKPQWSKIIEKFFGASCNSFIVNNKPDQERLFSLMKRLGCEQPVNILSEGSIDPSRNKPDPRWETILDVLDIDNDMVLKYMVINHNIEQVILIEDMREARDIMYKGPRIDKVKACFSFQSGTQANGERYSYGLSGPSTAFAEGWRGPPRIKIQQREAIDNLKGVLNQQREALRKYDSGLPALQQAYRDAKAAQVRHQRDSTALKTAANEAEEAAQDCQAQLDHDAPQQGRLEELKKQLEEFERSKASAETTFQQCVQALEENKVKRAEDVRKTNDLQSRVEAAAKKVKDAEKALDEAQRARNHAVVRKNELFESVDVVKAIRDDPEDGLLRQQNNIKDLIQRFIAQASQYGERIPVGDNETIEGVNMEYKNLEKNIAAQEARLGGTIGQLQAAFQEAKTAYEKGNDHFRNEQQLEQELRMALDIRRTRWQLFRSYITVRARMNFQWNLANRAFRGELKINHKHRMLDIEVQPDETQAGKGKRAAKTLSGGEKSFSQICLIIALWEAIGAPIRCLDEFDVFMDSVNRNLAMELLIEAARNSHGRQFILITPQSMGNVAAGPDVRVHKMRDPHRSGNQATLPFTS